VIPTQYTVTKTGFEMADVCHVYGVVELLEKLGERRGSLGNEGYHIEDMGWQWIVDGPEVHLRNGDADTAADALTAHLRLDDGGGAPEQGDPAWFLARGWNYLYVTNLAKDKASAAERLHEALPQAIEELTDTGTVGSGGPGITTPQGLETAGGKGSRAASRALYGEGQNEMGARFWSVAAVGAMAAGTFLWPRQGQGFAMVVPSPAQVSYEDSVQVRDVVRQSGMLCPTSTLTAIAHYAVKLALSTLSRGRAPGDWKQVYSGVVYEGMAKTGQRPKPVHGGLFPMDVLNDIVEREPGAGDLLQTWDSLLTAGGFTGREALALTLADFLMNPVLSTFERHCRTHLRMSLRQDVSTLYSTEAMGGLTGHVRAEA